MPAFVPVPRVLLLLGGALLLGALVACKDSDEKPSSAKKSRASESKPRRARSIDKPIPGIDKAVEQFTGAHTRLVWVEHPKRNSSDTFANSDQLVLKGLDTRDGKGERMIQNSLDNYARPLLSSDGSVILFTDKEVKHKAGRKHYDPDIYRTDWSGAKPVRIADGYAVDCWRDPVTGVEWVYATRQLNATKALSLDASRLVRFKLDAPSTEEIVYDDGPLSPDNVQFSRDGSLASGLFPWPNAGVLVRGENGKYTVQKRLTGCWPSLAPDNSGVLWVFDGGHRGATFFTRDKSARWGVPLNRGEGMLGREMYHPRWSNHPRFLVITGPYLPVKNVSGNVISKGGATAEVFIGRFSEKLDKVEAWLQITQDDLSESYPDMWVAGADQVQLAAFDPGRQQSATPPVKSPAPSWLLTDEQLLFSWHDRDSVNQCRGQDGKLHPCAPMEDFDAARYGRLEEMLLDGGRFQTPPEEKDGPLPRTLAAPQEVVAVQMLLLPSAPVAAPASTPLRYLLRAPGLTLALAPNGSLIAAQASGARRSDTALPEEPCHLMVVRHQGELSAWVNGEPLPLASHAEDVALSSAPHLVLGGNWEGGMMGLAIHARAFSAAEVRQQSSLQLAHLRQLPPPPPRVKVRARLLEASSMPTAEGIAPYTGALVASIYEVEQVLEGTLESKSILVKQWAMLGQKPLAGFPLEVGKSYELSLEREEAHPHLKGERVMDDTVAFDLESWFDVTAPRVR
jgi:hypothetical protein